MVSLFFALGAVDGLLAATARGVNAARIDVHGDGSYVIEPDPPRSPRVKPKLRRTFNVADNGHEWICSDTSDCYSMGWGATPEAAYEQWLSRFAFCRRSREQ